MGVPGEGETLDMDNILPPFHRIPGTDQGHGKLHE